MNTIHHTQKITSITFPVNEVEVCKKSLPLSPLKKVIRQITKNDKIEASSKATKSLVKSRFHGFMEALHYSYANHYPLTLSPDMIWLLIAQGFATHVNENSELLRTHFVNFEGKKLIKVYRDEFSMGSDQNNWLGVFEEFGDQIAIHVGEKLLNLVTGNFSTTGIVEKACLLYTSPSPRDRG